MQLAEVNARILVTSGDHVLVHDPAGTNKSVKLPPPDLPPNLTKGQLEVLNKEDRTINSIAVSHDNKLIAVAAENKQLVVFDQDLNVVKNFIVNRAASKIVFTRSGDILVADRTGDVYLYGSSGPVLLLGHLSMILDMVLSECERYIITCDRDEKIRVSHFPNTYNIVSFCLGHEEFVIAVRIVGGLLFSASGDGTVRVWDYLKGVQLSVINTNEFVSDTGILQQFSEKMDQEKVDVTSLPITDMRVCARDHSVVVAVSLYNYNAVQLYEVDVNTIRWKLLRSVNSRGALLKFHLSHNLYIFDNSGAKTYSCGVFEDVTQTPITDFYKSYENILKSNDSNITILYKRKFDNVQEYLERKKLRLESSK